MRRTMSTISRAVSTTMKAVRRKPSRPGVTWSWDSPGRSDGVGAGAGVVARARSKECTVRTFYGDWMAVRRWPRAALNCFHNVFYAS